MWSFVSGFIGSIVNGLSEGWKRSQEIAKVRIQGKVDLERAKLEAQKAKWEAKAKLAATEEAHVNDYDMQVLLNRAKTFLDEFISLSIITVVALHFIPATQGFMEPGWKALQEAPLWFQLSAIIVVVSSLGGLRVLNWARGGTLGSLFTRESKAR